MKRILSNLSILLLIALTACNALTARQGGQPPASGPTPTLLSPQQAQTQVAMMLTLMPTETNQPAKATATVALPTVEIQTSTAVVGGNASGDATQPAPTPVPNATNTPQPAAPTATLPAATATSGPAPTATLPAGPTFTPPPNDPRARLGSPTSTDPMDNEAAWVWPTGYDKYTSASFGNGVQTVNALTGADGWRLANPLGREFKNLYLEATIRTNTCSGSDHYGLIVRVPDLKDSNQGYLFGVTCDGKYSLRRWNGKVGVKGEMRWLINWTTSPAISTGSNQINRLGIFTLGSRLILYANGKLLAEVQDTTFPAGNFGIFIGSDVTQNMSIQVDEMSYWENPNP